MKKSPHRGSHFALAFLFLPRARRRALEHLYAVCRVIDDAVDVGGGDPKPFLNAWREAFQSGSPAGLKPFGHEKLASDFLAEVKRYGIPTEVLIELIDKGVGQDIEIASFGTAMDTERYCYGVASTVGLACLPLFGVPVIDAREFAIRLGIAVQWVNIVRDVGADAEMGRLYLPLEHLGLFGYTKGDVFARKNSVEFKALMKHEAGVARSHFKRAVELMPLRWKKELLPARIMGQIYLDLLNKVEKNDYEVFSRRERLNFFEKIRAVIKAIRQ